jgi:hypothetical protein
MVFGIAGPHPKNDFAEEDQQQFIGTERERPEQGR